MPPVDPRTYVPNTDLSAFQKLVQPSGKPTDTEDPASDGKCDHTIGCHRLSDTSGAPLAGAELLRWLVQIGHVYSRVGFVWRTSVRGRDLPLKRPLRLPALRENSPWSWLRLGERHSVGRNQLAPT